MLQYVIAFVCGVCLIQHVSIPPSSAMQIIAFGDFGEITSDLDRVMQLYHLKFPNPDYVFLLGDNIYIDAVSSVEKNSPFTDYVAKNSSAPHYVVFGNYDLHTNHREKIHYDMHAFDTRWIMPSAYYFQKFDGSDFTLCTWFLDTERFASAQAEWLRTGIQQERGTCSWIIVVGHKPGDIQASGEEYGDAHIATTLEPILIEEKVDVYLAAHHHNLQHLVVDGGPNNDHQLNVFISGRTALDNHSLPEAQATRGCILWGSVAEPAILALEVSRNKIVAEFHSGYKPLQAPPIYSTTLLNKNPIP